MRLLAAVITPSSNKIQNGEILVPANPGPTGKIAIKIGERERERERERDINPPLLVIIIVSSGKEVIFSLRLSAELCKTMQHSYCKITANSLQNMQ